MSQYYWGKPDTSVSFCEKKYDTLFWIAEYYNTISDVPYIFIGMAFYCTRIKNIGICLMFLGLSTMLMHGTLRYYGQWLDEIGLIVLSFESLKQLDKRLKYIFLPPILGIYFMFTENFLVFFSLAFIFWFIDQTFCKYIGDTQYHALWHISTCIAMFYGYLNFIIE